MGDILGLSGFIDIDFSKVEAKLNTFMGKLENAAVKMTDFWAKASQADSLENDLLKVGAAVATISFGMEAMTKNFVTGFSEIKRAGGEAFDYIGSRATSMAKEAAYAQSEIEKFNKSTQLYTKNALATAQITKNLQQYEMNSPFVISDLMASSRKLTSKGVIDPQKNIDLVKLAGEMASVNDKPVILAAEALRKIMSRSPEAYRSLKTNFNLGPEELKSQGVVLDSGDRLRLRTQSDAEGVITAIKKHYEAQTQMNSANIQATTIEGKLSTLRSQAFNTLAQYADIVAPKIKAIIDHMKDLLTWFQNLDPSVKSTIANFVLFSATAFTVVSALTPIAVIASTLASGIFHLSVAFAAAGVSFLAFKSILQGGQLVDVLRAGANVLAQKYGASAAVAGVAATSELIGGKIVLNPGVVATAAKEANPTMLLFSSYLDKAATKMGSLRLATMAWVDSLKAVSLQLGVLSGVLALAMVTNIVINTFHKYYTEDGKKLEDDSKVESQQKYISQYQNYLKMSKNDQDKFNRKDPTFLERAGKAFDNLSAGGNDISHDQSLANKDVITGRTGRMGVQGEQSKAQQLLDAAHKAPPAAHEWSLEDWIWSGAPKEDTDLFGGNDTSKGSQISNLFKAGRIRGLTDKSEASRLKGIMDSRKAKGEDKDNSQDLINKKKELEEEEKLGLLSAKNLLQKQLDLRSKFSKIGLTDDVLDAEIYKTRVLAVHEDLYNNIDKVRNRFRAQGQLSLTKDLQLTEKSIELRKKSFITQEQAQNEATTQRDALREQLGARPTKSILGTNPFDEGKDSSLTFMQDRWDAITKRNERNLDVKLSKPVMSDEEQKKNEADLNRTFELKEEMRKKDAEMAEMAANAENNSYAAGMVKLRESYLEKSKLVRQETQDQHNLNLWAHQQQQLLIIADEKLNVDSQNLILQSKGQFIQAELNMLAHLAAEKHIHERKNTNDSASIEAELAMKKKVIYMEEFIAWKEIQQQKIAFQAELKKMADETAMNQLRADASMHGELNQGKQIALNNSMAKDIEKNIDARAAARKEEIIAKLNEHGISVPGKIGPNGEGDPGLSTKGPVDSQFGKLIEEYTQIDPKAKADKKALQAKTHLENEKLEIDNYKQTLSDREKAAQDKADRLAYRETLLEKKMGKAKSVEDVEKVEKKAQGNIKDEYNAELALLELKQKQAQVGHEKDKDAMDNIANEFAQKKLDLQEKFLDKMKSTTDEMEKQKSLLQKAADEKGKFTMGGIYSSYDEIVKHDAETSGLFSSRYGGGDESMSDNAAYAKLGIAPQKQSDIADSLAEGVNRKLGSHRDFKTKQYFDPYNQYNEGLQPTRGGSSSGNGGGSDDQGNINIFLGDKLVASQPIDRRRTPYNNSVAMGGNGGCFS